MHHTGFPTGPHPGSRPDRPLRSHRAHRGERPNLVWAATLFVPLLWVTLAGCSPIVRPPSFVGARDKVADVTLLGPFDGQVVDANTSEPVQGATVVGIWSYDIGNGFYGPLGSEVIEVRTDQAGRYRIPDAPLKLRGPHVRLVSFDLVVYKRGYHGYRSDVTPGGDRRTDFTLRQNRVALEKWRESDSHAEHLLYLAPPPRIAQLSRWERQAANLDLYRALGGERAPVAPTPEPGEQEPPALQVLDASGLLTPQDVVRRTGTTEEFEVRELTDLERTHFYHGVHLRAVGREEPWDVAYRVWQNPPGGLGPVRETFEATLPGVEPTDDITEQTWIYEDESVRAVAFLEPEQQVGVLLTCGAQQCVDIETAIILAQFIQDNLDELQLIDAPQAEPAAGPEQPVEQPGEQPMEPAEGTQP